MFGMYVGLPMVCSVCTDTFPWFVFVFSFYIFDYSCLEFFGGLLESKTSILASLRAYTTRFCQAKILFTAHVQLAVFMPS